MTSSEPLDAGTAGETSARCQVCEGEGNLNARICHGCQNALGRRTAELLARARFDRDFACETFSAMDALGKQRFRVLLGDPSEGDVWAPRPARLRERSVGPGLAAARERTLVQGLAKCPSEAPRQLHAPTTASGRRH